MASMSVQELRRLAEEFVAAEPGRLGQEGWWRRPLLATAPVDARFDALRRIAAADHLHPRDLLPTGRSVVVFFIPFKKGLPRETARATGPAGTGGSPTCRPTTSSTA